MKSSKELLSDYDAIWMPTNDEFNSTVELLLKSEFAHSGDSMEQNRIVVCSALRERIGCIHYHAKTDTNYEKGLVEAHRPFKYWTDEQLERQVVMSRFTIPLPVFREVIGEGNVRKFREARNLDTDSAAYQSLMQRDRFSAIERGISEITLREAAAIANALKKTTMQIWPNGKVDRALRLQIEITAKMLYDIDQIDKPTNYELDPLVQHLLNGEFYGNWEDRWETRRLIRAAIRCRMRAIRNSSGEILKSHKDKSLHGWMNYQMGRYLNN